jgi:hypothetical protein
MGKTGDLLYFYKKRIIGLTAEVIKAISDHYVLLSMNANCSLHVILFY